MPKTESCEFPPETEDKEPPLIERIAAYDPPRAATQLPATADRWILASNLQKAIRRGLANTAVATANRLLEVDGPYLWRRLLVIAYEDIGLADTQLCHDLLKTFRRDAMHRNLGAQRIAGYFCNRMAGATKSRSLCDALAMLEFSTKRDRYESQCHGRAIHDLIDCAADGAVPVIERIAAMRHLCGYRTFERGIYSTVSAAPADLRREVVSRARLTELEATLFMSGQSVSELLNAPIPLIAPMVRTGRHRQRSTEFGFEGRSGILFSALDRHTRMGKKCFAQLARENQPIHDFFACRPRLDPVSVIEAAAFVVEGASLNRQLIFAGSTDLRRSFECSFLEHVGISPDLARELLTTVCMALEQLNFIRAEVMGWM